MSYILQNTFENKVLLSSKDDDQNKVPFNKKD